MYESTNLQFAKAYYHWFFLIQKSPLPEKMLASVGPKCVLGRIGRSHGGMRHFPPAVQREYMRSFDPHSTCEDYRAAATIDLVHDRKEKSRLRMPVLALWAKQGVIEALFDCLADWRAVAADVRGRALPCGHFIPEERPQDVVAELRRFLRGVRA